MRTLVILLFILNTSALAKEKPQPPPSAGSETKSTSKQEKPTTPPGAVNRTAPPQKPKTKASKSKIKDELLEELKLFIQGVDTIKTPEQKKPKPAKEKKPPLKKKNLIPLSLKEQLEYYRSVKDYPAQIRLLDRLIAKNPKEVKWLYQKILIRKILEYDPLPRASKKQELVQALKKITEAHPQFEPVYWAMFDLIHHYNEWTKGTRFSTEDSQSQALDLIRTIEQKFGENKKTIKYSCHYLMTANYHDEAKTQCAKAKRINSEDPDSYLKADYFLEGKSKPALLKILKKFPKSKQVFVTAGELFFERKDYTLAVKFFKKAAKFDKDYFPALIGTAKTLFVLDQKKEALEWYILACRKNKLKTKTPFSQAKASLSRKGLFRLANKYQSAVNSCAD